MGHSAADIVLREKLVIEASRIDPRPLGRLSTLNEWFADSHGVVVLKPQLDSLLPGLVGKDMELLGSRLYVGDIPLETLFIWFGKDLPAAPEIVVDQLLTEVGEAKA